MQKESRLMLAICLSLVFMVVEIVGGYLANSIAIYSDAAHLLTDIAGFAIALLAAIAAKAPGTKRLTFGFARAEVFGALGSVISLWVITAFLLYTAYFRAVQWIEGHPEPVDGFLMFFVACFGVCVNICLGWVFHDEHGGAFHPGHSHEHGHCAHSGDLSITQASQNTCDGNDHCHEHNHGTHAEHDHGHSHGHDSKHGHEETCTGHNNTGKNPQKDPHKHDGHEHGRDHNQPSPTESSPLLSAQSAGSHNFYSYTKDHRHHSDSNQESKNDHKHQHSHGNDVNIEAAYLHVLTDLIQSIGNSLPRQW
jgi:zinc transporter 2